MAQVTEKLGEYESPDSGRIYEIMKGRDGIVYCKCPAWKFSQVVPKTCKHVEGFLGKVYGRMHLNGCDYLNDAVEQAVRMMRGA